MLIIDIKVLSGSEEVGVKKALEKVGVEVEDLVITKETVETIGRMSLDEFNKMILELQQTFFSLKTPGGKRLSKGFG